MTAHVKNITDGIGVDGSLARGLSRNIDETISQAEKPYRNPLLSGEDISYDELAGSVAGFIRGLSDGADAADSYSLYPKKVVPEDIDYSESLQPKLSKNIVETVSVYDTFLRNAGAVMFDLVIRDDVLTKDQLDEIADSPPVGYTPFRQFHPGDYDYQEGMIGVRITGAQYEGQVGISGLQLNVDIPDITDRGTATVTAGDVSGSSGQHTVTFNKTFSAAPEVYPVWIAGSTAAVPEIISVTATQFVFILRESSSPSTVVEGTISWAALGK